MYQVTFQRLILVLALLSTPTWCSGQEISQTAVDRAHNFLKRAECGRQINNLMHFGTRYSGHECTGVSRVKDAKGNMIPGEFALTYRFHWNDADTTELLVFCKANGTVESVRPLTSTGIFQQPFLASQAVVSGLGTVIYEALKNDMNDRERQQMRRLIEQADTKSILEMQLAVQQAFGR